MAVRDLRIYSQLMGGWVYSWREAHGRKEVDAVVETPDSWGAFEVKLTGDPRIIDGAAANLSAFADEIDPKRTGAPAAPVVITATGAAGRRPDGVHVVPLATLGP